MMSVSETRSSLRRASPRCGLSDRCSHESVVLELPLSSVCALVKRVVWHSLCSSNLLRSSIARTGLGQPKLCLRKRELPRYPRPSRLDQSVLTKVSHDGACPYFRWRRSLSLRQSGGAQGLRTSLRRLVGMLCFLRKMSLARAKAAFPQAAPGVARTPRAREGQMRKRKPCCGAKMYDLWLRTTGPAPGQQQ